MPNYFGHKWSELTKEERNKIKERYGDNAKMEWRAAKLAAGFRRDGSRKGKKNDDVQPTTPSIELPVFPVEDPKPGDPAPGDMGPSIPDDWTPPGSGGSGQGGSGTGSTGGGRGGGGSGGDAPRGGGDDNDVNTTIPDSGGGYEVPSELTEIGYLGGGGAGLSKFDPGAYMSGLQANMPTWKGGGKAQATGMFNSRMNLGRN